MKTIVIIEKEAVELKTLVSLFTQWQKKINVITASEDQAAISVISKQQVDLVICDLAVPADFSLSDFSLLTKTFPYIPCIAISEEEGPLPEKIMEKGARHCLMKPLDTDLLLRYADEILDGSSTATTEGIPVHSFLQMLESEQQTCTLEVTSQNDRGLLYVKNGALIAAETKNFIGEEAAQLILTWQETRLRLLYFNGQRQKQISKDLLDIIVESFELTTTRTEKKNAQECSASYQLPLQHALTRGKTLPLQLGTDLKVVFFGLENEHESKVVGLVKGNCFIVENPLPDEDLEERLKHQRIMVKYVYRGRLWMFKSQLIEAVDSPVHLLYLEYPEVIHFHELRKAKRSSIFIPSTFHLEGEKELFGVLIDMSLTGSLCQIKHTSQQSPPAVDIDTTVVLRCLLPGLSEEQQLYGKVKNMKIEQGETRIGIEFESLNPTIADTLGKYLYSLDKDVA